MKKEISNKIKNILFLILVMVVVNSCMMGMKMAGPMMGQLITNTSIKERGVNTGKALNKMIKEVATDLSSQELDISSIAVWRIKSQTAGLNVEEIRQKLITHLVALNRFKVITRKRLSKLLDEQLLTDSGALDEKSAVEFGNLIGVEGFIDGYASVENNRFVLSFTLIETKSGVIVWAKTVEKSI